MSRTTLGLGLEYFLNVDHIPILTALERGCFERRDLDVQIVQPVNLDACIQLVDAGKLDLALTAPIHMPMIRACGLRVAAIGRYLETGYGLMMPSDMTLADLRGEKITAGWTWARAMERDVDPAGNPLGTYAPTILTAMAAKQGIVLREDEVTFVQVPYYLNAVRSGEAIAAFGVFENYELMEAREAGLDMEILRFPEYGVPSYGHLAFVATDAALSDPSRREEFRRFLEAVGEGVRLTLEDPDAALGHLVRHVPQLDVDEARRLYAHTLKCYQADLSLVTEEWQALARFANDVNLAPRAVTSDEMISPITV